MQSCCITLPVATRSMSQPICPCIAKDTGDLKIISLRVDIITYFKLLDIITLKDYNFQTELKSVVGIPGFQNPGFINVNFHRISPNRTLAQNTYELYVCILDCLAMLPSTKMKHAMGFVHTWINVKILEFYCAR